MTDTLQLIEQSLRRGGRNLTAKDIAGPSKSASAEINRLVGEGVFQKQGSRYVLTSVGRQRWDREASADRKQELDASAIEAFLRCVEAKKGKALTSADLGKHNPSTIAAAQRDGQVKPGAKSGSYAVTEKGEQFLIARLPLADQIARLKDVHRELVSGLAATTARLREDLGAVSADLQAIAAGVFTDGESKLTELGTYIDELESHGNLTQVATRVKQELAREHAAAMTRLDEETKKLQERERQLSDQIAQHERRIKEGTQWIQERLENMGAQVVEKPASQVPITSSAPSAATNNAGKLRDAILQIVREHHRTTRDVPLALPEVLSRVRLSAADLSLGKFHDAVRALYDQGSIRLDAYTRSLATIPDRTNALFLDGEVMYYVRPA